MIDHEVSNSSIKEVISKLFVCIVNTCQGPETRPHLGSTEKKIPETSANPNIWVYSGGLPKFRRFLIFCFQSAVLLPGLEVQVQVHDNAPG